MTGVLLLSPPIHQDPRGSFQEVFNKATLEAHLGASPSFHQDNLSRSKPWTLRGLHYQYPTPQGKLVSCIRGDIYDVIVDLREGSPTLHQWRAFHLKAETGQQLWIPEGMAHGFLALSEGADVLYKVTSPYTPAHERSIRWDDPTLNIPWPLPPGQAPLISPKDNQGSPLERAALFKTALKS